MIDLTSSLAKAQLDAIDDRVREHELIQEIADGSWRPDEAQILPPFKNRERKRAFERALAQVSPVAPRILRLRIPAAVGRVTWGGDDQDLSNELQALPVRRLARQFARSLWINGIAAGMAHELPEAPGMPPQQPSITRLGGYLQPYVHPDDKDRIVGLYQAWSYGHTRDERLLARVSSGFDDDTTTTTRQQIERVTRWQVRIYDWSDGEENATIRIWRDLTRATDVGMEPDATIENAPVPRVALLEESNDGLPLGPLTQSVPEILGLMATEIRIAISEELAAFPIPVLVGENDFDLLGPAEPITIAEGGDFRWAEPGNLNQLREQKIMREERLQKDQALPATFLGNDSPSGEAISQANIAFRQSNDDLSLATGQLMTDLVLDFANLVNTEAAAVSVRSTEAYDFNERIARLESGVEKGMLPLSVYVRAVGEDLPFWDEQEQQEWVEQATRRVNVDDLRASLADNDEGDVG